MVVKGRFGRIAPVGVEPTVLKTVGTIPVAVPVPPGRFWTTVVTAVGTTLATVGIITIVPPDVDVTLFRSPRI